VSHDIKAEGPSVDSEVNSPYLKKMLNGGLDGKGGKIKMKRKPTPCARKSK